MNTLRSKEEVFRLLNSATQSAALNAAVELGLFWMLAEKSMSAEGVAQALKIPLRRCHYWLQLLHGLGALENNGEGYIPSALIRESLINSRSRESWMHLAMDERERSAGVENLALYIQEPGSIWAAQGMTGTKDYFVKNVASPARAVEFTRMLYEVHQGMAKELAGFLEMSRVFRLLDVGGGSGVVSLAMLKKHPHLSAMVIDIESVCQEGIKIAEENGLSDRIIYYAADINRDTFPTGFDMVLLCDVGVFGVDLYRRLWHSLNPDGRLVIVFHFSPGENIAPLARLEWTFFDSLEDPDFQVPTINHTNAELVKAGYQPLDNVYELADQRIVLQAIKRG